MKKTLSISVRFIQPYALFHGSRNGAEPEWPPSPLRLFQALINAACMRACGQSLDPEIAQVVEILESLRPTIVASPATISQVGFRAYVPHNHGDLVTSAWHRGVNDASIATHRIEKDYRPIRLMTQGDDFPAVHYLFTIDLSEIDLKKFLDLLRPNVRAIYSLGWGIDQVVADATLIDTDLTEQLPGDRFVVTRRGGSPLRVPRNGTREALHVRHERFLNRLAGGKWTPVPPLTAFDTVNYRRDSESVPRPCAVFKLLDPNEEPARYSHAKVVHIAGMVRHVAIQLMQDAGKASDFINRFIRGKRDLEAVLEHKQISYVPLPSIGHQHADGMIRNVMLIAPPDMERELTYLSERIDGQMLKPEQLEKEDDSVSASSASYHAELQLFKPPAGKFISECYLGRSNTWHSVTPVILDGHNRKTKSDKPEAIARETEKLICKALQRAGIETTCSFIWQASPFLKSSLSAHKYDRDGRHTGYHRPKHLRDLTAVHLRLTFEQPVSGPLTIGAGRHCGFGLMAVAAE